MTKTAEMTTARPATFLGRVPRHHHPIIQGVRQESLVVLDEDVLAVGDGARGAAPLVALPKGTVVAVGSSGYDNRIDSRVWGCSLHPSGAQVSIPVDPCSYRPA